MIPSRDPWPPDPALCPHTSYLTPHALTPSRPASCTMCYPHSPSRAARPGPSKKTTVWSPSPREARHRRIPRQGPNHREVPRPRLPRRSELRAHPRPALLGSGGPGHLQGQELVEPRRGHGERLRADLRGPPGEPEAGSGAAQGGAEGGRDPPRHGRGPGRGIDQLAPARGPRARRSGEADRLPRDHEARHPGGAGESPGRGRAARAGPGGPAHPGPLVRLLPLPRPLEEGPHEALGRTRPERRPAVDRRTGGRAAAVPEHHLLGRRGDPGRRATVHGHPGLDRRPAPGHEPRLRLHDRRARPEGGHRPPRRGPGAEGRRWLHGEPPLGRHPGGHEGDPPAALSAVHHLHPAAGGERPAQHVPEADDGGGPAALRGHRPRRRRAGGATCGRTP